MYVPLRLPPSNRDFRVFREVQILGNSTWETAERHHISQTRVRQIVQHVKRWLAEHLPEESEEEQAKELRLARHLAAERLQWLYSDAMTNWNHTHDAKYLRYTVRVTTAMARLGIVAGKLEEVMAVHEDGLGEEDGTGARGQGSADRGQMAEDREVKAESGKRKGEIDSAPPVRDFSAHEENQEVQRRRKAFLNELRLQMDGGYILPPVPAVDAEEETIRDWLALLTEHACAARGVGTQVGDGLVTAPTIGEQATSEVRFGPDEPVTVS